MLCSKVNFPTHKTLFRILIKIPKFSKIPNMSACVFTKQTDAHDAKWFQLME